MLRTICACIALMSMAQAQVVSTWGGGNGSYADPLRWGPTGVPNNANGVTYTARVNSGRPRLEGTHGPIVIDQLFVAPQGYLEIYGGAMRALGDVSIEGVLDVELGGTFDSTQSTVAPCLSNTNIRVQHAGSHARLGGDAIVGSTVFNFADMLAFNSGVLEFTALQRIDLTAVEVGTPGLDVRAYLSGRIAMPLLEQITTRHNGVAPMVLEASSGGSIELDRLERVEGRVTLQARSAILDLPALKVLQSGHINLVDFGGVINAPKLRNVDGTTAHVGAGNTLAFDVPSYRFERPVSSTQFQQLFEAAGAGAHFEASFKSIDVSGGPNSRYFILARSLGELDLGRLRTATGHAIGELEFGTRAGGHIDLSKLRRTFEQVAFEADDQIMELPSLSRWERLTLRLIGPSAVVNMPLARSFNNCVIQVREGASFELDQRVYRSSSASTILSAEGDGSFIDASSVRSIDARTFGAGDLFPGYEQRVTARVGGTIDLKGLRQIWGPPETDREFLLQSLGGRIEIGDLRITRNVGIVVGSVGIRAHGDLRFTDGSSIQSFNGGELTLLGDLFLGAGVTYVNTQQLTLAFVGDAPQRFEVFERDEGPPTPFPSSAELNTLQVGDEAVTAFLRLIDREDNVPGAGPEALYVYNLSLLHGSTLHIGGLNVYTRSNSQWIHLNAMFAPGQTTLAFSQGFVQIPSPGSIGLGWTALACALRRPRRR